MSKTAKRDNDNTTGTRAEEAQYRRIHQLEKAVAAPGGLTRFEDFIKEPQAERDGYEQWLRSQAPNLSMMIPTAD